MNAYVEIQDIMYNVVDLICLEIIMPRIKDKKRKEEKKKGRSMCELGDIYSTRSCYICINDFNVYYMFCYFFSYLGNNSLTGPIPPELGRLVNLQEL